MSPDVNAALDVVFEAALLPAAWPRALDQLAAALGAAGGIIIPREPEKIELGFPVGHAVADLISAFVQGGWHRNDIRADRGWSRFAAGETVLIEHDLASAEERKRLPYYQELFVPFGVPWYGGVGFKVDGHQWCLSLLRGAGQGPYERGDIGQLAEVAPHLGRVVSMALRFRAAMEERTLEVTSSLGLKAVTLDRAGMVVAMSPAAEGLLGADIKLRNRRLEAARATDNHALQAVILAAVAAPGPGAQAGSSTAAIARPGRQPILVELIALPSVARDVFARVVALALLHDLDERPVLPEERVRVIFGLTPGEARVAVLIASGVPPRSAAEQLGLSQETVRTVLKHVFAKTGVTSQSQLAGLLSRLVLR